MTLTGSPPDTCFEKHCNAYGYKHQYKKQYRETEEGIDPTSDLAERFKG